MRVLKVTDASLFRFNFGQILQLAIVVVQPAAMHYLTINYYLYTS